MSKLINQKVLEIIKKKSEQSVQLAKKAVKKKEAEKVSSLGFEHLNGEDIFYRSTINDIRFHFQKKKSACKVYCFKEEQNEKLILLLTDGGYTVQSKFVDGFCYELTVSKQK